MFSESEHSKYETNKTMRTVSPFDQSFFNSINSILNDAFGEFNRTTVQEDYQIFSTPEGWSIRTDLPGFEKSELSLHFEDNALHLRAEKAPEAESKRPAVEHRFALGEEVDTQGISAKLENGVLEITLPRKEAENLSKQIEIL
ncbi:hypothetical protein Rhal01_01188 [Rubritalea halochordaticola]|uniref:SHSP domain-containing protein n=2 Tax=Rubritalea halochordaticola TaxID=714537 RepID=A0ABP9UX42_9BACT